MNVHERLNDLFGGLGQDPLEDIGGLMDLTGTDTERDEWLAILDAGLDACSSGDHRVIEAINSGTGFAITSLSAAAEILIETRAIYLDERNK